MTKVIFAHGSHLYVGDKLIAKDDDVQLWLDDNLADRGLATLLSIQGDIKLADVPAPLRPHLVAAETVTPGIAWLEQELHEAYETYWTPKTGGPKNQAESLWNLAQANHAAHQKELQNLLSQNPEGQLQMAQHPAEPQSRAPGPRATLVVFDDNLVHTDPARLKLACQMLTEAAQSCQILLLSCHPERFLPNLP